MKKYNEIKDLPFKSLSGISEKTIQAHHGKLYQGYVKKWSEIQEKLATIDLTSANATYSDLRELKIEESFASNGVVLHEAYFSILGGNGEVPQEVRELLGKDFASFDKWLTEFKALGLCSRGWVVLAYDFNDGKFKNLLLDAHNLYGLLGVAPILVLDMYEHAYFMDFGADKKSYIETFFKNINWSAVQEKFLKILS